MPVTTKLKRSVLRQVYKDAAEQTLSLLAALEAYHSANMPADGAGGTVLVGSSTDGHSVSLALPPMRDATPDEMRGLAGELLDLYDLALAHLIADGDPTPTDAEIYTEMLSRLVRVTSYMPQFISITP